MLLYVNSFVDRQIIAVLGESIRQDLGLSFTDLGWLYGPSYICHNGLDNGTFGR